LSRAGLGHVPAEPCAAICEAQLWLVIVRYWPRKQTIQTHCAIRRRSNSADKEWRNHHGSVPEKSSDARNVRWAPYAQVPRTNPL